MMRIKTLGQLYKRLTENKMPDRIIVYRWNERGIKRDSGLGIKIPEHNIWVRYFQNNETIIVLFLDINKSIWLTPMGRNTCSAVIQSFTILNHPATNKDTLEIKFLEDSYKYLGGFFRKNTIPDQFKELVSIALDDK